jgi:pimeloyl-ACP methyl ester carboxylesterase
VKAYRPPPCSTAAETGVTALRCELVRVQATDGIELAGIYAEPDSGPEERAFLHTHGLAGNFYENRFVSSMMRSVTKQGLAFLATNNRGHDYRSDNLRGHGTGTVYEPGGSMFDIFGDCVHDIAGGLRFLTERDHVEITLSGHSLGCNKTVYYLSESKDPRCVGVVLISPPEMLAIQEDKAGGGAAELLTHARELVESGQGDTLLDVGRDVPFSAATFVSMFGNPDALDIFPFRHGRGGDYRRLASLEVPLCATYGTVDEAVNIPVADAAALLKEKATSSPRVETTIIQGANHVYWGRESELAHTVAEFVAL